MKKFVFIYFRISPIAQSQPAVMKVDILLLLLSAIKRGIASMSGVLFNISH